MFLKDYKALNYLIIALIIYNKYLQLNIKIL
jgi:hypothetical protein